MHKSQNRNACCVKKNQGKVSLPKVKNSTIKDLNDSEVDEISNDELKTTMIIMANTIKEDI
jgi:hypothetical protein